MSLIVGLTGSIASGKSTVSHMFQDLDIPVVDADIISREVVEPGMEAYEEMIKQFGKEIMNSDSTINRATLGDLIFTDKEKREQLNSIIHPAIRKEMLRQRDELIAEGFNCVVLDIPLLFENNLTHYVDKTLVVYVDENVQLERLMKRNHYTKEEALLRIQSQMTLKEKVERADEVINNNGGKNETREQLKTLLEKWLII